MKTIFLLLSAFLITSSVQTIDYSGLEEKSVAVQINGNEKLTFIPGEKCFYTAGEGIIGYNSRLSVKGEETVTKIKKGSEIVFYVRRWSKVAGIPLSIVKMNLVKGKRIASSKEGITSDKDKKIKAIPFKAVEVDQAKGIYKVTLNDAPGIGTWCVNFNNVGNGKFVLGSGYGKQVFCFTIVE